MIKNPRLTEEQLAWYQREVGCTPTKWAPRNLEVGAAMEEAKDKLEVIGYSGRG